MKKITNVLIFSFILLMLIVPVFSLAQGGGLVPCNNTPVDGVVPEDDLCDFNAFMALINKVINFILFVLAIPIAAIMFTYAGILLVTSGGSTESRSKAKGIFKSAVIGFILAAGAWLIVNTLLSILSYDGDWIGF